MDEEPAGDQLSASVPFGTRQVRARRRRRRRRLGVLLFVAVAAAVFAAAYFALAGGNNSSNGTRVTTTASGSTTTTVVKAAGPYKVTTGVNVRQGAGTTFPSVGTIETGRTVFVACVVDGEVVNGPTGPIAKWLKLTGFGPQGYVTALYVNTGNDLTNNKIPTCPRA